MAIRRLEEKCEPFLMHIMLETGTMLKSVIPFEKNSYTI
jgi:hypothetical protein